MGSRDWQTAPFSLELDDSGGELERSLVMLSEPAAPDTIAELFDAGLVGKRGGEVRTLTLELE